MSSGVGPRLFALALLLASARARAVEPGHRLRAEVAPEVRCPSADQLRSALAEALPDWSIEPGPAASSVRVEPAGAEEVWLVMVVGGRAPERRRVSLRPEECPQAAQTLALIAKVWLRRLPALATEAPPRPPRRPSRAVTQAPPQAEPTPVEPVAAQPAAPVEASVESPEGPEAEPAEPAPAARWLQLEALLGGAALFAPDPGVPAAAGSALLDLGLGERFGVGLGTGLDTPLSARHGPGTIDVTRSAFSVGGRLTWTRLSSDGGRLHLRVSALLQHLAARTQGFAQSGTLSANAPGLGVAVVGEQRLWRGASVWVGPEVRVWARAVPFVVEGVGTVLQTPQAWVGLAAGVGWRFF